MADIDYEQRVRAACFVAIGQLQGVHGDVLPVDVIMTGVVVDGGRIALINPYKGIHKPRQLDAALAVTTTPPTSTKDVPYDDRMGDDGLYVYHYRTAGSDSRQARQQENVTTRRSGTRRATGSSTGTVSCQVSTCRSSQFVWSPRTKRHGRSRSTSPGSQRRHYRTWQPRHDRVDTAALS